jgi:hypothetical protein
VPAGAPQVIIVWIKRQGTVEADNCLAAPAKFNKTGTTARPCFHVVGSKRGGGSKAHQGGLEIAGFLQQVALANEVQG